MSIEHPKAFVWPWSAGSIAAGLLSIAAFVTYGKLHWLIVHMVRDNAVIPSYLRLVAILSKPGSELLAVIALVLYMIALRKKEPMIPRCFALAFSAAGCMTIPVIT